MKSSQLRHECDGCRRQLVPVTSPDKGGVQPRRQRTSDGEHVTLRRSESSDEMRVGVTNLFTVEPETSAVESTECRTTAEGLTSTT